MPGSDPNLAEGEYRSTIGATVRGEGGTGGLPFAPSKPRRIGSPTVTLAAPGAESVTVLRTPA
eukprot:759184-Hanusia_phi.AAC.1